MVHSRLARHYEIFLPHRYCELQEELLKMWEGVDFGNLSITQPGQKRLRATLRLPANLTVSGDFQSSTRTCDRVSIGGTLSISNVGTLRIGGQGLFRLCFPHIIRCDKHGLLLWFKSDCFSPQPSESYGNLRSQFRNQSLDGDITVAGTLTISTSAVLSDGGYTLSAQGNISTPRVMPELGKISLTEGLRHTLLPEPVRTRILK